MEKYQLIVELSKVLVWPIIACVFLIVFCVISWPAIKERLKFLTRARYKNIFLEFEKPFENPKVGPQGQRMQFDDPHASPMVNEDKKIIMDDLRQRNLSSEDQIQLLIHELANNRVYCYYWWITNNILIEHVEVLKKLNQNIPLTKEQMKEFYDQYVNTRKESDVGLMNLEQFFAWLSSNGLIIERVDASYFITDKGRDYLKFLIGIGHHVMSNNNNNSTG